MWFVLIAALYHGETVRVFRSPEAYSTEQACIEQVSLVFHGFLNDIESGVVSIGKAIYAESEFDIACVQSRGG